MHVLITSPPPDIHEFVIHVTYQISGFDRINFVNDITAIVLQDSSCEIRSLSFEADGLKANGLLIVQMRQEKPHYNLARRLQSVRGMVSVREV
ncbi:hypothetical protein [Spirosoma flavum]|uniref:ACT domain-containing protein n=1 Tax=Spirosoma flavum TaxID=2048557 RepID=A0ABW6AHP2_9BACT